VHAMKKLALVAGLVLSLGVTRAAQAQDLYGTTLERGETARKAGQGTKDKALLAEAASEYRKAVALDATRPEAPVGLSQVAALTNDKSMRDEAVKALKAVESSGDPQVVFQLGTQLFKLGRLDEALPYLERSVATPDLVKVQLNLCHFFLGLTYKAKHNPAKAAQHLEAYLQAMPNDLGGQKELAGVLVLAKKYDEAIKRFEALRAKLPNDVDLPGQIGLAYDEAGRCKDAIPRLEEAMAKGSKLPKVPVRLAGCYLATGQKPKAQQLAEKLAKEKSTPDVQMVLGDVYAQTGDKKRAFDAYSLAAKQDPKRVDALAKAADLALGLGRTGDAIAVLEAANERTPDDPAILGPLGRAHRKMGAFLKAEEVHRKLVALRPNEPEALLFLAADFFASGQYDRALATYEEILAKQASNATARKFAALALERRAIGRLKSGSGAGEATVDLRRALDLAPSTRLRKNVAIALLEQKEYDQALELLGKIPEKERDFRAHILEGYGRAGKGDFANATVAFERAIAAAPVAERPSAYVGWAVAQLGAGKVDEALGRLKELLGAGAQGADAIKRTLALGLAVQAYEFMKKNDLPSAEKSLKAALVNAAALTAKERAVVEFVRGLYAVDTRDYRAADQALRIGLASASVSPEMRGLGEPFLRAYLRYRAGENDARGLLEKMLKKNQGAEARFVRPLLVNELVIQAAEAFAHDRRAVAEKAIAAAEKLEPADPMVRHIQACLQFAKSSVEDAVKTWREIASTVPEANANVGLYFENRKSYKEAWDAYRGYLQTARGPAKATVTDWADRLGRIHGYRGE
jgi:tetratricopeptide (TPR) repeat protein